MKLIMNFVFFLLTSLAFSQTDWELQKNQNGIKIYTKFNPNEKLKSSKAEMVVDVPTSRILEVLKDIPNYVKWTPRTESAKLLKTVNSRELYYYTIVRAPMLSDRDLVVNLRHFTSNNVTTVILEGVPNYVKRYDDYVRMPYYYGKYILTDLRNGKTKMELEYNADPGGSLPSWIVNAAAIDIPFDIFTKLNELL